MGELLLVVTWLWCGLLTARWLRRRALFRWTALHGAVCVLIWPAVLPYRLGVELGWRLADRRVMRARYR